MDGLIRGTLRADPSTGCLWLEEQGGEPLTQLLIQGDYRVDFSQAPVTVLDGETVAARVGERVNVGGGFVAPGQVEVVQGCPAMTSAWLGYFA